MSAESKEFARPDLIMIPSMQSKTGWKYVEKKQLDSIREYRTKQEPGFKDAMKNLKAQPVSKNDPNQMFPDITSAAMKTGGLLQNKLTGL